MKYNTPVKQETDFLFCRFPVSYYIPWLALNILMLSYGIWNSIWTTCTSTCSKWTITDYPFKSQTNTSGFSLCKHSLHHITHFIMHIYLVNFVTTINNLLEHRVPDMIGLKPHFSHIIKSILILLLVSVS